MFGDRFAASAAMQLEGLKDWELLSLPAVHNGVQRTKNWKIKEMFNKQK